MMSRNRIEPSLGTKPAGLASNLRMSNRNRIDLSPSRRDRRYLEFDLDAETMALVEEMAAEDQVTPFEMCVQLLRERALRDGETEPVG